MNASLFLLTTTLALIGPVPPKAAGPYEPTLSGCLVTMINRSTVSAEEAGVLVFSPQGALLTTLGGADVRKARAVTVDPAGAVLVYDDKLQRILRFK